VGFLGIAGEAMWTAERTPAALIHRAELGSDYLATLVDTRPVRSVRAQ
jgi:hypothetical protein